ncbi:MAG: hydrogenase [Elusimicrobia bacterium]|nr:hydrogenase [Elusimicrobiota bacterium]
MENIKIFFQILVIFSLAPILPGIINRVKAKFAGRQGRSIFQLYFDLYKLINRGMVYPKVSGIIFKMAAPSVLAFTAASAVIMPFGGQSGLLSFSGDFLLIAYFLAFSRFLLILSAMDTSSAFEGMGASREAQFAVFAEPVFFMSMLTLSRITGETSVYGIFSKLSPDLWIQNAPVLSLITGSLFILLLCESSRVPFDDPDTHLELTMIHEVMILDNSGTDLAFMLYASYLKFWIYASFVSAIILPRHSDFFFSDSFIYMSGLFFTSVAAGVTESIMARVRLLRVPQFLLAAFSISVMAFVFQAVKG